MRLVDIRVLPEEAAWAAWAIDPMADYWDEQAEDGASTIPVELPVLEGALLRLPLDAAVITDFLYRLEDQAADMTRDAIRDGRATRTAYGPIHALARKIRKAAKAHALELQQPDT